MGRAQERCSAFEPEDEPGTCPRPSVPFARRRSSRDRDRGCRRRSRRCRRNRFNRAGDPQDPNRAVIVISVSASLDAPHMVDGSYWRRSAIGKAKLTDPEVRRLLLERERRKEGFEQRLARMRAEIDPTAVAIRRGSHLYLLLEPQTAVTGPPLHELLGTASQAFAAVSSARDGEQQFPPTFDSFTQAADHPDGYLFSSPDGGVSDGAGSDLLLRTVSYTHLRAHE